MIKKVRQAERPKYDKKQFRFVTIFLLDYAKTRYPCGYGACFARLTGDNGLSLCACSCRDDVPGQAAGTWPWHIGVPP